MKEDVIEILEDAGKLLLEKAGNNKVYLKDGNYDFVSLVTEADFASEKLIIERLENIFPDHNIFSEEKGFIEKGSDKTWYIDPLDGTSNFTRGVPLWGISIGLIDSGEPIFGAISIPALKQIAYAEKGSGAFLNGNKISVSRRLIKEALFYGRGYYKNKLCLDTKLGEAVGFTKIVDSSSYEFVQIACGNAEIYSLVNNPHDVTAGVVLVREAGGKVTDFDGSEWTVKSKGAVATNGVIHEEILKLRDTSLFSNM